MPTTPKHGKKHVLTEWFLKPPCPPPDSVHWTLQRFGNFRPAWYALHEHTDSGVAHGLVGLRPLIDAYCTEHRITPEPLPPISQNEHVQRWFDSWDIGSIGATYPRFRREYR
jgi:hypothetical protein